MKRGIVLTGIIALALGFILGSLYPADLPFGGASTPPSVDVMLPGGPAGSDGSSSSGAQKPAKPAFDPKNNFTLLNAACSVARALRDEDYALLSTYVDAERGVTFTPYSFVDFEQDVNLTAEQIRDLAGDATVYTWGVTDGSGELMQRTISDYFKDFVSNADYTQAPQIGIDRILIGGNALENLPDAYPGCRFVDFTYPGMDAAVGGLDWCSLKLVFQAGTDGWRLVGVVHGQWTV